MWPLRKLTFPLPPYSIRYCINTTALIAKEYKESHNTTAKTQFIQHTLYYMVASANHPMVEHCVLHCTLHCTSPTSNLYFNALEHTLFSSMQVLGSSFLGVINLILNLKSNQHHVVLELNISTYNKTPQTLRPQETKVKFIRLLHLQFSLFRKVLGFLISEQPKIIQFTVFYAKYSVQKLVFLPWVMRVLNSPNGSQEGQWSKTDLKPLGINPTRCLVSLIRSNPTPNEARKILQHLHSNCIFTYSVHFFSLFYQGLKQETCSHENPFEKNTMQKLFTKYILLGVPIQ